MALFVASSFTEPLFTLKTIWTSAPDWEGSAFERSSYPAVESVPFRVKESLNLEPID